MNIFFFSTFKQSYVMDSYLAFIYITIILYDGKLASIPSIVLLWTEVNSPLSSVVERATRTYVKWWGRLFNPASGHVWFFNWLFSFLFIILFTNGNWSYYSGHLPMWLLRAATLSLLFFFFFFFLLFPLEMQLTWSKRLKVWVSSCDFLVQSTLAS